MKASDYAVKFLKECGIDTVFGYQGGNITHIIDSVDKEPDIRYLQTYHEQAAAFAACSYAQIRGCPGVAVSSSGPGATNMITGIANAYYDSIPCVFITGNVNTATMRKTDAVRQNAFQEADIVSMVRGITKYAVTVRQPTELAPVMQAAVQAAVSGRPGPVLIDIPHDIQRQDIEQFQRDDIPEAHPHPEIDSKIMSRIIELLRLSRKPLILIGGGMHSVNSSKFSRLLRACRFPVVASLCGLDVVEHSYPGFLGMLGTYGLPRANQALAECDVLLVMGSRLDERQLEVKPLNAFIVHIDIDEHELGRAMNATLSVQADLSKSITAFADAMETTQFSFCDWWRALPDQCGDEPTEFRADDIGIWCNGLFKNGDILCADVGLHQMGLARRVKLSQNRLLNSAGLGSMGYALPAAIGACYAAPEADVWCFAGDGGIQMNIQELETIKRENLPVKIIVVNNHALGMVRNYHEKAFAGRTVGTVQGYSAPDFRKIAEAYGIRNARVRTPAELTAVSRERSCRKPLLIEIVCKV